MKRLLILFSLLLHLTQAYAQTAGFPTTNVEGVDVRIRREKRPLYFFGTTNTAAIASQTAPASSTATRPTALSAGISLRSITYTVPAGFKAHINSVSLTADRPCQFVGYIKNGQHAYTNQGAVTVLNGTVGKTSQQYRAEYDLDLLEAGVVTVNLYATEANQEIPIIDMQVTGYEYPADQRPVDNTLLVMGDSRTHSTMGNVFGSTSLYYNGSNFFFTRFAELATADGKPLRAITRGFGGAVAEHLNEALDDGYYNEFTRVKVYMVLIGVNDAANPPFDPVAYKAVLQKVISLRNRLNPTAWVLFLGTGPTDRSDRLSQLASVNQAIQDVVTANAGQNVYFFDPATVLNLSTVANDPNGVMTEQVLGSQLHWNGKGHKLLGEALYTQFKTLLTP